MPNGKFGQSGGRHLFPILLLDFLCVKVFFSFHPDPVHFFLLSGLDLTDTCFLCSVSYAWQSYYWFPILNIWRFFVAFLFVNWKDYYLAEGLLASRRGLVADDFWWLMISDGRDPFFPRFLIWASFNKIVKFWRRGVSNSKGPPFFLSLGPLCHQVLSGVNKNLSLAHPVSSPTE